MGEKKKILIATPIHTDNLILQYVTSIFEIMNNNINNKEFEVNTFYRRGSLVNRTRNELIGLFLESKNDYIFFIDSDIVDFADSFYTIALSYFEIEKENPLLVLGAAYPIKHFNFDYIQNETMIKNKDWKQIMLNFNCNLKLQKIFTLNESDRNNGVVSVDSIGGGFMMFSRYVVNEMIKKYPDSYYRNYYNDKLLAKKNYNLFHSYVDPTTKYYLSEDYGFCKRFSDIGGLILGNIKLELSHYGEQIFTGSLYNKILLDHIYNNEKKNILLSVPRCGNHIIRTLIELLTGYPTAGLINVNDAAICTRNDIKLNFNIKSYNKFIYYKQHDVILDEEKHYITNPENVINLILIVRNPIESFIREDNYDNNNNEFIQYKRLFREVYFSNIDFYKNVKGKKLLLYYEDIITNKIETINKIYNFIDDNQKNRLEYVLKNIDYIYNQTLKVAKKGGELYSNGKINFYSNKYQNTECYEKNKKYILDKINNNEYYQKILSKYNFNEY